MPDSRKRFADAAFLVALMLYILSGVPLVPVHGDEYMQMAMAHDYFALLRGESVAFVPPVERDTPQYLRLINGSLNKYLIGFIWQLAGCDPGRLPGIYVWEMPLEWNREAGNVPTDDDLHLARWPSAILTALGVIPVFMLGWHLRLRSLAYPAALLYALHPVILLNGRRAMMEGSLMLFTLLAMYWLVALIVAEHSAAARGFMKRLPPAGRYIVLGLLVGLAVAAKHTGVMVGIAVLSAAFAARAVRGRPQGPYQPLQAFGWTVLAGIVALMTWFALNPTFWPDPVGALRAAMAARFDLLSAQMNSATLTYISLLERPGAVIGQPFLTPPQYYEAPNWAGLLDAQIAAYEAAPVNGFDWGPLIGLALTALAGIGVVALIHDALQRDLIAWGILAWAGVSALASLTIPIGWQRYYLPLLLVGIVLAAEGMGRLLVRRDVQQPDSAPNLETQPTPGANAPS